MLPEKTKSSRGWQAKLDIDLALREQQTVVSKALHYGPLRIQKSFPQADGSCHLYLLHPPGGLVAGDQLSIRITAEHETRTLITTPSAGKFYRCLEDLEQKQTVQVSVGESSQIEWLPQENIFFDGAKANIETEVYLASDSVFVGWEIQCLGRQASGECFRSGFVMQRLRLYRDGRLVHRERLELRPATPLMNAGWGLGGMNVIGALIASIPVEQARSASRRIQSVIAELNAIYPAQIWGFSSKESVVLGRYLGESPEECRAGLNEMRLLLDAADICATGSVPRIWKT